MLVFNSLTSEHIELTLQNILKIGKKGPEPNIIIYIN